MPYTTSSQLLVPLGGFFPFSSVFKVHNDKRNNEDKAHSPLFKCSPWVIFKNKYHLEMLIICSGLLQQWTGYLKHPANLAGADEGSARQSS